MPCQALIRLHVQPLLLLFRLASRLLLPWRARRASHCKVPAPAPALPCSNHSPLPETRNARLLLQGHDSEFAAGLPAYLSVAHTDTGEMSSSQSFSINQFQLYNLSLLSISSLLRSLRSHCATRRFPQTRQHISRRLFARGTTNPVLKQLHHSESVELGNNGILRIARHLESDTPSAAPAHCVFLIGNSVFRCFFGGSFTTQILQTNLQSSRALQFNNRQPLSSVEKRLHIGARAVGSHPLSQAFGAATQSPPPSLSPPSIVWSSLVSAIIILYTHLTHRTFV